MVKCSWTRSNAAIRRCLVTQVLSRAEEHPPSSSATLSCPVPPSHLAHSSWSFGQSRLFGRGARSGAEVDEVARRKVEVHARDERLVAVRVVQAALAAAPCLPSPQSAALQLAGNWPVTDHNRHAEQPPCNHNLWERPPRGLCSPPPCLPAHQPCRVGHCSLTWWLLWPRHGSQNPSAPSPRVCTSHL